MGSQTDIRFSLSVEVLFAGKLVLLPSFLDDDGLLHFFTKVLGFDSSN